MSETSCPVGVIAQGACPYSNARMNWISVKGRLPEKNTDVLALIKTTSGYVYCIAYQKKERWYDTGDWEEREGITHWMPLPELPKGD